MAVFADSGVVECVSAMMKGLGRTFQQKKSWRANPRWETSAPGVSESSHLSLSLSCSPSFAQIHLATPRHPTLHKHNKKKNLIPLPVYQPCLWSLGKWMLYCVSVHNTVSTASASDWFTASLAQCRLTGWLDSHSFAEDPLATNTHNSTICGWLIFINEFERNPTRGQRNKVDSAPWWYIPAVSDWQSRDLLFTTSPASSAWDFSVRQKPAGFALRSLQCHREEKAERRTEQTVAETGKLVVLVDD